ncbi:TRAP transporter substrate-binding protein [Ferrimonas balearica]|nr:TRAP transporter substrate-binding protein [Ferrimonas balearica]
MSYITNFARSAALALAAAVATPALAQESIKVGTFVPEQSTGVAHVIKPWLEAVQEEAGDAVRMQAFWGGTLGKDPYKQFDLVQNGVADVTWVLPIYTAGQFPEMGIFELPFLFTTAQEASAVGWGLMEQGLMTGFDGVHVVGFFTSEQNALFMKPVLEDLDGLANQKVRSAGSISANWLESFGAAPQTLSSAEFNEGLSRGTVDGAIQGWTGMKTFKSFPLVDQAIEVPVGAMPFLLLMNERKWNSLSPEVQEIVMKHGGEAFAQAGGEAYASAGEEIRADIDAEGRIEVLNFSDEQLAAYQEAAQPIHEAWIAATPNGQAVYDAAVALLAEYRGES